MGCSVTKTKVEQNLNKPTTDTFEKYIMTQSILQSPPVSRSKYYQIEKNPIILRRKLKSQLNSRTPSVLDKQTVSV